METLKLIAHALTALKPFELICVCVCVCKCVFIGCIRITNNLRSPSVYLDPWTIFFFSLSHSFCVCFGFYFSVLFLKVIACITYNCVQKSVNLLLSAVGVVIWHFINDFWYLPRNADLTLISHTQNDLTKSTSTSVDKLNFDDFFGKVWMKHPTTPEKKIVLDIRWNTLLSFHSSWIQVKTLVQYETKARAAHFMNFA